MAFWKRPTGASVSPSDDVEEARRLRADAEEQYGELLEQRPRVARLTSYLVERKELNGFGEEVHISFTPKERHA
jgi:hypothetical protein